MGFFADGLVLAHLLSSVPAAVLRALDGGDNHRSRAASPQSIRDSLASATFGDVADRRPETRGGACAVCLGRLRRRDQVRELRNCPHVFHRECIDRWVDRDRPDCDHDHDHDRDDNRGTCPLCRAPLLVTSSQGLGRVGSDPSWAVERILYLFGDDLLVY